jgi:curved DNA-binding protein CbpA
MKATVSALYSLALDYSRKPLHNQARIDVIDPASDSFTSFLESLKRFPDGLDLEKHDDTTQDELRLAAYLLVRQRLLSNPVSDYQVLGLSRNATPEQLRQRYRLMMALFHPDRHITDDNWVQQSAIQINQSYSRIKKGKGRGDTPIRQQAPARSRQAEPVRKTRSNKPFEPMPDEFLYRTGLWQRHPKLMVTGLLVVVVVTFLFLNYSSGPDHQVLDQQLSNQERNASLSKRPSAAESSAALAYMLENSQQHDRMVSEILTEPARRIPADKSVGLSAKKASVEGFVKEKEPVEPQHDEIPPIAVREDPPGLLPPAPPTDASKITSGLVFEAENRHPGQLENRHPGLDPGSIENSTAPRMDSGSPQGSARNDEFQGSPGTAAEFSSTPLPDNIDLLLARYVMAYQAGEIAQMMQLFSVNRDDSNSFTAKQIRDEFIAIFSESAERRLQVHQRRWNELDDGEVLIRFVASSNERKPGSQEWSKKQSLVELKVKQHGSDAMITAYRQELLQ